MDLIIVAGWVVLVVGLLAIARLEVGPFLRLRIRSLKSWWSMPDPVYRRDLDGYTWPCTDCGAGYKPGMAIHANGGIWLCDSCSAMNRIHVTDCGE